LGQESAPVRAASRRPDARGTNAFHSHAIVVAPSVRSIRIRLTRRSRGRRRRTSQTAAQQPCSRLAVGAQPALRAGLIVAAACNTQSTRKAGPMKTPDRSTPAVTRTLAAVASLALLTTSAAQACTSFMLTAKDGSRLYGRTMEFGVDMKAQVTLLPRGLAMAGSLPDAEQGKRWTSRYAALGFNGFGLPILVDGFNEKGLAGGMLFFPGSAKFVPAKDAPKAKAIASWEFLSWALTRFASVAEVKQAVAAGDVVITDTVQVDLGIAPPLHYTLHDATGASIVIEPVDGRLVVTDNPYTVLTNAPDIGWQQTNLRNYTTITPEFPKPAKVMGQTLVPFSTGSGMRGLPGDQSSPSRYVQAVALVATLTTPATARDNVQSAEHILNHFDLADGSTGEYSGIKGQGGFELTYWTAISDFSNQRFYFKTYENQQLRYVDMKDFDLNAKAPRYLPATQPFAPQKLTP
jgi:choloylglycine hydrolase